jgi:MFS family permease
VLRLSLALFLIQAGFHGFTAAIPLALSRAGRPDSEIGVLVGVASLIQIPAALVGGALIDRYGGIKLLAAGGACYLVSCALLLLPGLDPSGSDLVIGLARGLQGAGFGLCVPAALSVVPRIVPLARRGLALATANMSNNLSYVLLPVISIIVLDGYGLDGVTLMVVAMVVIALGLTFARPMREVETAASGLAEASRRFGFAFRRSWLTPLAITVLFIVHWGVITAYMPQRAEQAGANIGLFFAADGLFVLLARIPAGWLADRTRPMWPILGGIAMTFIGVLLLLPTPTTQILIVSGALTGIGAALIVQPILLALTSRSTDADRGSAFALFSASFAAAVVLGAIGTAPLIEPLGFETVLLVALGALFVAAVLAVADRGLRTGDEPGRQGIQEVGTPVGP